MRLMISDLQAAGTKSAAGNWPSESEQELLFTILRTAGARAAQQQRKILASITLPVEWRDSLQSFTLARQAGLGECFFWEKPAEQTTLVGIGAVTSIEQSGATCFTEASSAWRSLLAGAVIAYTPAALRTAGNGPVLYGGFAFDPLATRTQRWAGFPDGLLVLPRFLLCYSINSVTLTVNSLVSAGDAIEQKAQQLESDLGQLQASLAQPSWPAPELPHGGASSRAIVQPGRPAAAWRATVAAMVDKIRRGACEKVVLARDLQVVMGDPREIFEVDSTLQRLRESYPGAYVFAVQRGERFFVGATPERLVQAQDGQISTMALAGSARRGASPPEDRRLGTELLHSEKNMQEHAIVVAMVREALQQHCKNVRVSVAPQLLRLKDVQHLQTPIAGELIPGRCILDVLADLHPTPAVGGFPRQAALEEIRASEMLDRGWYAGPLGWIGAGGHGEFAVALRCGLIESAQATLFAGCGIVADSTPRAEYVESCLKFQAMLRGLGIDEG